MFLHESTFKAKTKTNKKQQQNQKTPKKPKTTKNTQNPENNNKTPISKNTPIKNFYFLFPQDFIVPIDALFMY